MIDDRAATETMGFVLTFALVTAAIAIIYTGGFAGLQDARDAEQIENVERAFEVLSENLEDVRRYGTPSRSTEIRLLNGNLSLGAQSQLRINVSNASTSVTNPVATVTMRPIVFTSGDGETKISYEGGALFRTEGDTSLMLSEPGWQVSDDRLVLSGVQTYRRGGPNSLDVRGTALVVAHSVNHTIDQFSGSQLEVTVTINSSRVDAWARHLNDTAGFTQVGDGPADGQIQYEIQVSQLYISRAVVGIELSE